MNISPYHDVTITLKLADVHKIGNNIEALQAFLDGEKICGAYIAPVMDVIAILEIIKKKAGEK